MRPDEPLISWPQPILEYLGFLAIFFMAGAIGFRFVVLPALRRQSDGGANEVASRAARRAAIIGLIGALLGVVLFAIDLPGSAAERHVTVTRVVTGNKSMLVEISMLAVALFGFALALGRVTAGWPVAALGVVAGALRAGLFGQWARLVNPMHELAAGFWIGTLFVMVVAGISTVLGSGMPAERRGAAAAGMVRAFSPLALTSAAVLATFGVWTACRHLHTLKALWTTPYGAALIVKLGAVLLVVALGAWNWRRQRPRMGSEAAAWSLRRSAYMELAAAALVLAITAILVSLPSPRPPRPQGRTEAPRPPSD